MTLIECILALLILSIATVGILCATTAGHQHLDYADADVRAIRLAEHLLEEIQSRPYAGSGADRTSWHVDDYDGFLEDPGALSDFAGELYAPEDQLYRRAVSVSAASHALPDLEGMVVTGKTIEVNLSHVDGREWIISRFMPEPFSP